MSKKLKVMFSTHGLVEGDFGFATDEYGFPVTKVLSKKVITGQDTGGQVYYVKALAGNSTNYDVDLVTRRVDPRICPQFGGTYKEMDKSELNYTIEAQWHESENIRSRVLRVPAGGNFMFVPKEEIVPLLPELVDNLFEYYKKNNELNNIEVVEGHYRDGMLAADMLCTKIENFTGRRPIMLVTSHSLGHKKFERNLPHYQSGKISEEEWKWHNFEQRIYHEKTAFDKADIIIATSQDEQVRLLAEPYLSDASKITVIAPGYNDAIFAPLLPQEINKLKHQFEYKDLDGNVQRVDLSGKKVVSSLGRVVPDKGFAELSRSMAEIMRENPDVVYMVSGEKGNPVTEECKSVMSGFTERGRVIFLPSLNQKEMARIYNVSDVFVMSSLNEAFGMVPIEAMGCKTAVIVGRSGFNDFAHCADIRDDKQDFSKAIGLYAPSQEEDRWRQVKALKLLLGDEKLHDKIAQNGYNYVRENLTWEQISAQKDRLVQKVLDENPQRVKISALKGKSGNER
ncbi:MAG: glycosyltransferase [Alphaproteobacteria bacterium]|nr:glycosyltransferase [Alphaproteobacteria bacterium]